MLGHHVAVTTVQAWASGELVRVLVAGSVHPLVIAMAVLQAGQDHLLRLVDDRQVPREVLPSHPEAGAPTVGFSSFHLESRTF